MAIPSWIVVCLALVTGCEKDAKDPAKAAAPAGSGSAGSADVDAEIETFVAGMIEYGDKSLPILAKFDGNCGALADQMMALEPLAQSLRALGTRIELDPVRQGKLKARMRDAKDPVTKHYEETLAPYHLSLADLEKKDTEMKAKCAKDPRFIEAQERTGLMKKKSKP